MEQQFQLLKEKFKSLIQSEFVSFERVASMKNITGVYIIYSEKKEIIYIGNTNKFHVRFGTDLKHESTHTLVRKLIKGGTYINRHLVVDYLKNQCCMKIEPCETKRQAEALEGIAIYLLNPQLNK